MNDAGRSVSRSVLSSVARSMAPSFGGIVAVGNLKGGVGKSTVAVGLAGAMARAGKSVALVDGDPQATSRRWLMSGDLPIRVETLDLESLSSLETWLERAERLVTSHGTVLIDLPAVIGPAMASAFLLARVIVVPVSLSPVDLDGTLRVLRYIEAARAERLGRGPEVLIVPNKLPRSVGIERSFDDAFERFGETVAAGLSLYPEHGRAFAARQWIGDLAPGSRAHQEVLALEATLAQALLLAPPAPRIEAATRTRREREPAVPAGRDAAPAGKIRPASPRVGDARPWWQRLFAPRAAAPPLKGSPEPRSG